MRATVLLVDDDDDFREALKLALELEEFTVMDVNDGRFVCGILETEKIDVVITDILMPEIEGNELANTIRVKFPGTNIIGLTGGGKLGNAEKVKSICVAPLFKNILTKPCTTKEIVDAIETVLAK